MKIQGRGVKEYLTAFEQGRIKPEDPLFVGKPNENPEHYIIVDKQTLEWGNVFNRKKAETSTLIQILGRKKWYVEVR